MIASDLAVWAVVAVVGIMGLDPTVHGMWVDDFILSPLNHPPGNINARYVTQVIQGYGWGHQ